MEEARLAYIVEMRSKELISQMNAWTLTERILSYSEAIQRRSQLVEGSDTYQWVEWMEAFAASIDPLQREPAPMPSVSEPTPEDLKPFLEGWSPHGPDGRWF